MEKVTFHCSKVRTCGDLQPNKILMIQPIRVLIDPSYRLNLGLLFIP